jgi:hypothetical protein
MQAGASRYIDRPPESRRGNDFTHHKNSGAPGGPTAERRSPIPFPTGVHSFPIQRGSEQVNNDPIERTLFTIGPRRALLLL